MRHAKRTDDNHREVVEELRRALPDGTVKDLSGAGNGIPDILVGWRGMNFLFEIKDPSKPASKQKLTPRQVEFHENWQGQAAKIHSAAEALSAMLREIHRKQS